MELLEHKAIFTAGYKAVLHIYSVVEECEIMELLEQIDPRTKNKINTRLFLLKPGVDLSNLPGLVAAARNNAGIYTHKDRSGMWQHNRIDAIDGVHNNGKHEFLKVLE